MENTTISINNFVVTLRSYMTFGEKRQLQKLLASFMKVDAQLNQNNQLSMGGDALYDAQDFVLRTLIVSLTTPDGKNLVGESAYKAIQSFHTIEEEQVANAIYDKVSEITKEASPSDELKKN